MLIIWIAIILVCFYLLAVVTDEFFIISLDEISKKFNLSPDMAGATFMAIGSSAPELFTSLIAVLRTDGLADIGAGTIVGSAIFNILVIIGASASFRKAHLNWQPVVRDMLFYAVSIILLLLSFIDGQIVWREALLFVGVYIGYLVAVFNWRTWLPYKEKSVDIIELLDEEQSKHPIAVWSKKLLGLVIPECSKKPERFMLTFSASVLVIIALSYVLVEAAVKIAHILHIPTAIIALTVLAVGTSIPDLLASMAVAKKGRGDMAVSNAVGSNIFDILIGLGGPWLIVLAWKGGTVQVATENLLSSVFLLFATIIGIFFLLFVRRWSVGKRAGWLLIGVYLIYIAWNIFQVV
jgi:K+-dependent Na+/Ca+ exchanger-like protein